MTDGDQPGYDHCIDHPACKNAQELPALFAAECLTALMRGFIITDHYDRFPAFVQEVSSYIRDRRMKYNETIAESSTATANACIGLLNGRNLGMAAGTDGFRSHWQVTDTKGQTRCAGIVVEESISPASNFFPQISDDIFG